MFYASSAEVIDVANTLPSFIEPDFPEVQISPEVANTTTENQPMDDIKDLCRTPVRDPAHCKRGCLLKKMIG